MYTLALLSLVAFVTSLLITPLTRDYFLRVGLVDAPDGQRKIHKHPIPRVGGIPVALAYAFAFIVLLLSPLNGGLHLTSALDMVWRLMPSVSLMLFIGLFDDLSDIRPWAKLVGQICAALMAYWAGVRVLAVGPHNFEELWWSLPLTVFWLVFCTNAFNLIDGVDGLASGVGLFATVTALIAALMHGSFGLAMATAPLAGALLAFLRFNFNPASIFLGDSGSYFVGFLLGCYSVMWSHKAATLLGMTAPLLALAIPLLDVCLSIARRFLRGNPIFTADRGHIHHKLLDRGFTPRRTVLVLYGVSGLFATFSLVGSGSQNQFAGIVLILFAIVVWVGVQNLGYLELNTAGRMIRQHGFRRLLNAELAVRRARDRLDTARPGDETWSALVTLARDLGYDGIRARLDGEDREELFKTPPRNCWVVRFPIDGRGWIEMTHLIAAQSVAPMVATVSAMLDETLGIASRVARLRVVREAPEIGRVPVTTTEERN